MYLYVDMAGGTGDLPEGLLAQFGEPEPVMILKLSADRKLARADAAQVLAAIEARGFYLQMPPSPAEAAQREGSP
jgi:uncharacterized protein YcgL (UPF0745 family)